MKHKSEVLEKFKEFEVTTTNAAGRAIGTLRTDNGGEYLSSAFQNYLKEKGIRHELTVPHSPQQNGVSERMNRTLVESARSMIAHAGLSNIFLGGSYLLLFLCEKSPSHTGPKRRRDSL